MVHPGEQEEVVRVEVQCDDQGPHVLRLLHQTTYKYDPAFVTYALIGIFSSRVENVGGGWLALCFVLKYVRSLSNFFS